jgi:hypothetical protein
MDVPCAMSVGPEEAIMTGFQWTDDSEKVAKIAVHYREQKVETSGMAQKWIHDNYRA